MASIFQLFGEVYVENEKANKNIDDTSKKGKSLGEKLGGVGKKAAVMGAAVVDATAAAATGAFKLATKTAGLADEIDKASQRAGMGAESFQEWTHAASMSGIEASTMEKAMVRQQKLFAEAKSGSSKAGEAYKKLGLDISSISKSEDAFEQVMSRLGDMTDESERNAVASSIFGKSYADLAPLLNTGAKGMKEARQEARDLGIVMSKDAVKAGADLGDNIERLKKSFKGLVNNLGSSLMPVIDKIIQLLLKFMPQIQSMFDKFAPVLTNMLDAIMPLIIQLVESLLPVISELLPVILEVGTMFVTSLLPPLIALIEALIPIITLIIEEVLPPILELIQQIMPIISELVSEVMPLLIELFMAVIEPLLELISDILPVLIELFMDLIVPLIEILKEILPPLIELFISLIKPLMDLLKNIVKPLTDLFIALIKPLMDLMKSILKPLTDLFLSLIKPLLELLNKILTPLKDAFKAVADILTGVVKGAVETVTGVFDGLKKIFGGIIDFLSGIFTGNWKKVWNGIVSIFEGIWETMKAIFKAPINWIIDGLNRFIRGLNKIRIPDWVPGIGGYGINIGEIPRLAKGADKVLGPYIAGEAGPELIMPKAGGSQVIPLSNATKQAYNDDGLLREVIRLLTLLVNKRFGGDVWLDGKRLVGALLDDIDQGLATKQSQRRVGGSYARP